METPAYSISGATPEIQLRNYEALYLDSVEYKANFSTFKNCRLSAVVFQNVNLSKGILFDDCELTSLKFLNVSTQKNGGEPHSILDDSSITFNNCTFNSLVEFVNKDGNIFNGIKFQNCRFKNGILIDRVKIISGRLEFINCEINVQCKLSDLIVTENAFLDQCRFTTLVTIIGSSFNHFTIHNCEVIGTLEIFSCDFDLGLHFNSTITKENVRLTRVIAKNNGLSIVGCIFEESVIIDYHLLESKPIEGIDTYHITHTHFTNGLYVNGKEDSTSEEPNIRAISIIASVELKGDILFRGFHIDSLKLSGYNTSANLRFDNLNINYLEFDEFINNGGLILSRIKASYLECKKNITDELPFSQLRITNSNLGKAQLYQVDFSSFSKVHFSNNIMTEIITSLVIWMNPNNFDNSHLQVELELHKLINKKKDKLNAKDISNRIGNIYKSRQELYRQLKFASQKQGDIPQSLEFQKNEMKFYKKSLDFYTPKSHSERLILYTNWSNDYGQNWIRALLLLLPFSFAFYIPIGFLSSAELDYSKIASSWQDITLNLKVIFHDNLKTWLILLNPAHRIKDINDNIDKYSGWIYFWDLLSRIVVSYFLFQTISAFRKFSKM